MGSAPDDGGGATDPTRFGEREPGRDGALAPGGSVGRYVILELIGRGGMGVVYRAWDPQLDRAVALKLVDAPDRSGAALRDRLVREAQALAQLAHPNVVTVHDVGTAGEHVFVAMEFVSGAPVPAWLAAAPRSEQEIVDVFVQAGRGLAAAHAAGLVHRDFKPANVVVGKDGRARVLDFGLARAVDPSDTTPHDPTAPRAEPAADRDDDRSGLEESTASVAPTPSSGGAVRLDSPLTRAGTVLGTPRYMSPEQHRGHLATPQSDQFSFCVSLWECLFGARPFVGANRAELRERVLTGAITRPDDAKVSPRVERALRRGLAPDPAARFPTIDALLAALQPPPARRRTTALAAALIAIAAGALVLAWMRGRGEPPCAAAADSIWDERDRAAVKAAFDATHDPRATFAYDGAARTLADYATRLDAMRVDACRATNVRHQQSAHLLDLRTSCLDRRRDAALALVDQLVHADRGVVAKAIEATHALPPIEACADGRALEAVVPPPADPRARRGLADAQRQLAHVAAMFGAGRYADALPLIDRLARDSAPLAYPPLDAEIALRRGGLLDRTGDYLGAEQAYRSAAAAADAGRDDELRAQASTQLAWVVGARLGRNEEARRIASLVRGTIDRLDRPDRLVARYDRVLGVLDYSEGKYADALAHSQDAVRTAERAFGPDDPYVASCVMDVGLAYFYLERYDEARPQVQRALDLWRKVYGPVHGDVAAALNNLGEIERAQGRHAQAIEDYRAAADVWGQLGSIDLAEALGNLGESERALGRLDDAREHYDRAVDLLARGLGLDHPRLGAALFGRGRVLADAGDVERAIDDEERAVTILGRADGDPLQLADARAALAADLVRAGRDPARSRALALDALLAYRAAGARGAAGVAAAARAVAGVRPR